MNGTRARSSRTWRLIASICIPLALIAVLMVVVRLHRTGPLPKINITEPPHLRLAADNLLFSSDGEQIIDEDRWLRMYLKDGQATGHAMNSKMLIIADHDARYGALSSVVSTLEKHGIVHLQIRIGATTFIREPLPEETGNELPPTTIRVRADQNGFANGLICGEMACGTWRELDKKLDELVGNDSSPEGPAYQSRAELILPHDLRLAEVALACLAAQGNLPGHQHVSPHPRQVDLFPPNVKLETNEVVPPNMKASDFFNQPIRPANPRGIIQGVLLDDESARWIDIPRTPILIDEESEEKGKDDRRVLTRLDELSVLVEGDAAAGYRLHIREPVELDSQLVDTIRALPNVISLSCLNDTRVDDASVAHLAKLPGLRLLFLTGTNITDASFKHLKNNNVLVHLTLSNTKTTDDGLRELSTFRQLESLVLNNTRISDKGLTFLSTMPLLSDLSMQSTEVTDEAADSIRKIKNLSHLDLGNTKFTSKGLAALGKLPKLETLHLVGLPINDDNVALLSNFPNLTQLSLKGTSVTDAGVIHLTNLRSLRVLSLANTRVTKDGAQKLRESIPGLFALSIGPTGDE